MSTDVFSKVQASLKKLTEEFNSDIEERRTNRVQTEGPILAVESDVSRNRDAEGIFLKIKEAILTVMEDSGMEKTEITMETSIVDDLGFTSLNFVDLTIAIEEALGIDGFPMLGWIDEENLKADKHFTVYSLVQKSLSSIGSDF
ncbi:MAG: hypothetical protein JXA30_20180 [Deltaproteobacteria bacterium]|nr:hypothetical protein [Deltaproteobacteria bacterium]